MLNNHPIFYQESILEEQVLSPEDSRHCVKVLRMKPHDIIAIVDGKGGFYIGELLAINDKKVQVKILEANTSYQKKTFHLHIAIAPTKNADRLEWFVEKATEIGIDEISLIHTEHTERKFQKTDRLEKIAISAMKQSQKAYLPKINEIKTIENFIGSIDTSHKFVAHWQDKAISLQKAIVPNQNYCILIGPEGDFSEKEITMLRNANFQIVTLGNARLRTETAALVATTIVNLKNIE